MDKVIQVYQEEISLYQNQIELLKEKNASIDEQNEILTKQVQDLKNILGQAKVANQDLYSAFDQVRRENQLSIEDRQDNSLPSENQLALEAVEQRYIDLARDSVSWISQKDKMIQRIHFLERECERYNRDNGTLSKQVRHLIRTLEEERGMIIRRSPPKPPKNPSDPITALEVIDNNLVTFESIERLQQQNQKLLSIVNKLAKEDEERQMEIENDDIKKLTNEIQILQGKLEEIKSEREQVVNAFNTVLKERDLFKVLLCNTRKVEHLTPEIFQRMVSIAVTSGPAITNEPEDTRDKDARISDLKEVITRLERQVGELRDELRTTKSRYEEELKLLNELLEKEKLDRVLDIKRVEALDQNNKLLTEEYEKLRTANHRLVLEIEKNSELKDKLQEEYQKKLEYLQETLKNTKEVSARSIEIFERMNSLEEVSRIAIAKAQDTSEKDQNIARLKDQVDHYRDKINQLKMEKEELLRDHQSKLQNNEKYLEDEESKRKSLYEELELVKQTNSSLQQELKELHTLNNRLDLELNRKAELKQQEPDYTKISTLIKLRNQERSLRLRLAKKLRKINKPLKDAESQTDAQTGGRILLKRRT